MWPKRNINNELTGKIIALVCEVWNVTRADLTGRSRPKDDEGGGDQDQDADCGQYSSLLFGEFFHGGLLSAVALLSTYIDAFFRKILHRKVKVHKKFSIALKIRSIRLVRGIFPLAEARKPQACGLLQHRIIFEFCYAAV